MGIKSEIKRAGGWVVSCDTLRSEDLLGKFCATLANFDGYVRTANRLQRKGNAALRTMARIERKIGYTNAVLNERWQQANDELSWIVNEDLFDALNEAAPAGYYFSSQEGDGACFGFWKDGDDY
jgi:hypothetical protein